MQKIFSLIFTLSFLAVGTAALAQGADLVATSDASFGSAQDKELPAADEVKIIDAGLPKAGLTPDSPFYFLKSWKESIQTFFTFGAESKAKQFLHLADVRLAEYEKMIEKGKAEIAQKTLEKYEKQLNRALEKSQEAQEQGRDVEKLTTLISEATIRHHEVLNNVLEKIPEEAKIGIENAIEMSQKRFDSAIQQKIEEGLKQASPEVQSCVKSMINNVSSGELKGSDISTMLLNCLAPGTKIPSIPSGGGINIESLKYIEEFYGSSLSPKDLEALKKAQEQLKGIIPQGTEIPSSQKTLNLEDIKKIQGEMEKNLQEVYKNMTPEELEYLKKAQEQGQFDNATPPEIQGGGSGTGMGL